MLSTYIRPLPKVDELRPTHREFIARPDRSGILVAAGRRRPAVGGVVLLDVPTEQDALRIMAADPYVTHGVASYEPIEWLIASGSVARAQDTQIEDCSAL